ncbi:MAG: ASCH domain-containing protein [Alphaproteobacteria bacterium]|nr:ASCH domain-containing protein [Alphaproteobacteria bacterium]
MLRFDTPATREFWQQACHSAGVEPATTHHAGTFAEPRTPERAPFLDQLSMMAADGQKCGTAHMKLQFDHETIPMRRPGDCWIVTTVAGDPLCVVRITGVTITPFEDVGDAFAASEGEGDLSVVHWRGAHINYFRDQCEKWGHTWHDAMPIVCESFELIYAP